MPTIDVIRPRLHPAQRQVRDEARRYNVLAMGRRWGKTTFGMYLVTKMIQRRMPVGWFAATNKLQAEAWRDLVKMLGPATTHISQKDNRLEFYGGAVLEMWSLEGTGAGRSRKYGRVIVDEGAFARNLESDYNEAIRPTLTDYRGDAWFFSTPKGRDYFWTLWMRGQDPADTEWASWQMPTSTNPYINPAEIEAARRDMPERAFRQEYLAEFIEDGAGVFRRVREQATATPQAGRIRTGETGPWHEYVGGVDWGKHADFTVISIIDTSTNELVYLDRFNRIDYRFQLSRLRAAHDLFQPGTWVVERNSMGEPLIEQVRDELPVLAFTTNNASKAQAIEALSLALERGDLRILDNPVLVAELLAYESERLPSGLLRYTAPPGMHDDCVMSLALAWHGAAAADWSVSLVG